MIAQPLLEIRSVRKSFGGVIANDDISFEVHRGSFVGLIGPNGSGKTTLFNCISRQIAPDSGTVRFAGRDTTGLSVQQMARLGLARTYQECRVYDGLSCLENLLVSVARGGEAITAVFRRQSREDVEKPLRLLEFVDLIDRRNALAGTLSYGQRRLLEFAMVLMGEPTLLLLDEPTAGVHPTLVDRLVDRIGRAAEADGLTVLLIEHNVRAVMALACHIHCLAHGRLLASGAPDEIRANPAVVDAYLGRTA